MRAGLRLSGRYALEALLGSGGMGEVWRGIDEDLDRPVAVKVLREHFADQELAGRFRREARIAAQLRHPGITTVYDIGSDDGCLFIVMELLHGRDLEAALAEWPAGLPVGMVVELAVQAAGALHAAHAGHIVHRDLKPANLFVQDGGQLKICDFGIALAAGATAYRTATGHVIGTPAYMSPEQCQALRVDERSDLYSLGCVIYALLAGQPPFGQGEPFAVMYQHVNAAPVALRTVRPDVPEELERLVLGLLAKDPAVRPPGAGHVAVALQALRYTPAAEDAPPAKASLRTDPGLPRQAASAATFQPTVTIPPGQALPGAADMGAVENDRLDGQPHAAGVGYRQAAGPDRARAAEHYRRAGMPWVRGGRKLAEYREAARLDPGNAGYRYALAGRLREAKRTAEAEAEYQVAARLDPGNAAYRYALGLLLREAKRTAEAEAEYREAARLDPGNAAYRYALGLLLREAKRTAEAEAEYREAARLDPGNRDYRYALGSLLREAKRLPGAGGPERPGW